jgi:hypothetical protein
MRGMVKMQTVRFLIRAVDKEARQIFLCKEDDPNDLLTLGEDNYDFLMAAATKGELTDLVGCKLSLCIPVNHSVTVNNGKFDRSKRQ